MASNPANKPPFATPSSERPRVTSYDSGYEYSVEHWFEVRQLVELADAELKANPEPLAIGKAS
jgi:hypothetical protein